MLRILITALGLILGWEASAPLAEGRTSESPTDPQNGRLIFAAADCASCHASPGQEDRTRLGGGIALASPFGTFRAPNISSDKTDGIGAWRTEDLANALWRGIRPDGAPYYPVMPYTTYTHMTMQDVRDLMAYLRTLPAIAGRPPDHELVFPFNIRSAVRVWQTLYFSRGPLRAVASDDAKWQRGRYLVEAVAHCAECHSSRGWMGAIKPKTRYAGGPNPEGIGFAPNITPARLGSWSQADIVRLLTDGHTPSGRVAGGAMADVVTNTATLPQDDREAIAAYIVTLPPRPTPEP